MIRFVEMTGIYLSDQKSFGFYDTVIDKFVNMNGIHAVDSLKEFEDMYTKDCGYDYERLKGLIPNKWLTYEESED